MNSNRISLLAPCTATECLSRLTAAIDSEPSLLSCFVALQGSKPVVGWVTESSMRLRKRLGYSNAFQGYLRATMRPAAGGTVILGKITMHPLVWVYMILWFGGIMYLGGSVFLNVVRSMLFDSGDLHPHAWIGAVMFPVMLVLGFGLVWFGRRLAADESRFLKDFLIRTLHANEQNGTA